MERFVLPAHGRSETQPTQHPKALPLFFGRKKPGQKHHHFLEVNQKPEGSFFFSHFFRENSALFLGWLQTECFCIYISTHLQVLHITALLRSVSGVRTYLVIENKHTHTQNKKVSCFFWALKISAEDTPRLNKRLGVTWVVQVAGDGNLCGIWVV